MDMELLNYITTDLKWNTVKKGRRSTVRRPRAVKFESGSKRQDLSAFETKLCTDVVGGHFEEKIVDAPLKKRRVLHQSPSPPPETTCLNGEGDLSPSSGPQTPSLLHEDPGQRCRSTSLSQTKKTKSKTGSRKSKKKEVLNVVEDFSGIELLATLACSSFINEELKEETAPGVDLCSVDVKEPVTSTESQDSSIQENVGDNGKEEGEKNVAPSKELRLHWDLNTVMDDWEEPQSHENCSEGESNSVKLNLEGHETRSAEAVGAEERSMVDSDAAAISVAKSCNGDSFGKTYESIEDLSCPQEVICTKTISSKTSESCGSKSDVVDSLTNPDKCEELSTSTTTSVLREETIVKVESDTIDEQVVQPDSEQGNKLTSEVTKDEQQGDVAEGDTVMEKAEVGYDSPFEDGELREPIESEFGTIDEPSSEKFETVEDQSSLLVKDAAPKNDIEQVPQADTLEKTSECQVDIEEKKNEYGELRPPLGDSILHNDESTSFDVCRNRDSSNSRSGRDSGREKSVGRDKVDSFRNDPCSRVYPKNVSDGCKSYNPRSPNYSYRNRRASPSERNSTYRVRSPSRDRCRFHPSRRFPEDPKPSYLERKVRTFTSNFNRPSWQSRSGSRSRSRSGSPPIAWNFQKRRNSDTNSSTVEIEAGFDDRKSTMIRRNQRLESIGYPERLKSDDHFRIAQRSGSFSQMAASRREHKYKDNRDVDHYEKVNRVGRSDDNNGVRRFRYTVDDSLENRNRRTMDKEPRVKVR